MTKTSGWGLRGGGGGWGHRPQGQSCGEGPALCPELKPTQQKGQQPGTPCRALSVGTRAIPRGSQTGDSDPSAARGTHLSCPRLARLGEGKQADEGWAPRAPGRPQHGRPAGGLRQGCVCVCMCWGQPCLLPGPGKQSACRGAESKNVSLNVMVLVKRGPVDLSRVTRESLAYPQDKEDRSLDVRQGCSDETQVQRQGSDSPTGISSYQVALTPQPPSRLQPEKHL